MGMRGGGEYGNRGGGEEKEESMGMREGGGWE